MVEGISNVCLFGISYSHQNIPHLTSIAGGGREGGGEGGRGGGREGGREGGRGGGREGGTACTCTCTCKENHRSTSTMKCT